MPARIQTEHRAIELFLPWFLIRQLSRFLVLQVLLVSVTIILLLQVIFPRIVFSSTQALIVHLIVKLWVQMMLLVLLVGSSSVSSWVLVTVLIVAAPLGQLVA